MIGWENEGTGGCSVGQTKAFRILPYGTTGQVPQVGNESVSHYP